MNLERFWAILLWRRERSGVVILIWSIGGGIVWLLAR
jgi:hypothetical protein